MTPARRLHIISLVTNLKAVRDEHRGRTVTPIHSGGTSWDGRARTILPADLEMMQDAYDAARELIEKE